MQGREKGTAFLSFFNFHWHHHTAQEDNWKWKPEENNTHLPQSEGVRSKEVNKHHNEQGPAKGVHLRIADRFKRVTNFDLDNLV